MFYVIVDLIIKYVIINSNDFVEKLNCLQQKISKRRDFERQMRAHDKQRVFENSSIVIQFFFLRVFVIIALIIIALIITASIINDFSRFNLCEDSSRISNNRRFKVFADFESEKIFTVIQNVDVDSDDNEIDKRSNYVKCYQIFFDCRCVIDMTCARCAQ